MNSYSETRNRVISLVLYTILLLLIQWKVVATGLTPNENAIWIYSGFASLLFGSRLLNPHFTPPADAATNSFFSLAAVVAGSLAVPSDSWQLMLIWGFAIFCGTVCIASIVVLLARVPAGVETRLWIRVTDRAVRSLGSPSVIFTLLIFACVVLFHRARVNEAISILVAWALIVTLRPVEAALKFLQWTSEQLVAVTTQSIIGPVAAYQSPGIVLVRQSGNNSIASGTPLIVVDNNGPWLLGVALNYVGRDEGNLLRVLTAPLPNGLMERIGRVPETTGVAMALAITLTPEELANVPAIQQINRLCGVVVSGTNLDYVLFEVTEDIDLFEGRLVETRIGNEFVVCQIIEGLTCEDIVQQKNTYGYARAKARKIGRWDIHARRFLSAKWLPKMNAPVFLCANEDVADVASTIGHFPGTGFGVGLDVSEAVTHNTAVLGILGIGKSYLAIELVERMIAAGIKVICLDLTNQYAQLLTEFVDAPFEAQLRDQLIAAGQGGRANQNQEQGGSHLQFQNQVILQLRAFVDPQEAHWLRIINPAQFEVTRQAGGMFNGNANMATLTPAEITAIVSAAALKVCQELGMTEQGRVCLVYEEAHSLVPEWNSVVAEGDKAATAKSASAILQGRKYGLGCLLVTQRTANVTKTILNQCNTIFAMRTFDDTGKEFLSNYIGGDYAGVLPSLEARHAVVFGKASSCENPVLVRLNNREEFVVGFRRGNPVPVIQHLPDAEGQPAEAPITQNDLDDEIPF